LLSGPSLDLSYFRLDLSDLLVVILLAGVDLLLEGIKFSSPNKLDLPLLTGGPGPLQVSLGFLLSLFCLWGC
jgi:hypothetical protein